jgi:hypothetical protein
MRYPSKSHRKGQSESDDNPTNPPIKEIRMTPTKIETEFPDSWRQWFANTDLTDSGAYRCSMMFIIPMQLTSE